jgi:type II secretory ATPase GspE/PulE/Tfp pilus assembly ATPase PilB-like protein
MLDLGGSPQLLAAALRLVIAQKLLRRVCPACAVEHPLSFDLDRALRATFGSLAGAAFRRGRGCVACHQLGTSGRIGAFEVMEVTDDLRRLLSDRVMPSVLQAHLQQQGFISIEQDAFEKAAEGLVSPDEILQVRAGVAARVAEVSARSRPGRRGELDLLSPLGTAEPPFPGLAEEPEVDSWEDIAGLAEALS